MDSLNTSKIVKIPTTCFGRAHIEGKRFPVWSVVIYQRMGMTDNAILDAFSVLTQSDLDAAWNYYRANTLEIDREVWYQDTIGSLDPGKPIPWQVIVEGIRLGLSDNELREYFEEPPTEHQIADAWNKYRNELPRRLEPAIPMARVA